MQVRAGREAGVSGAGDDVSLANPAPDRILGTFQLEVGNRRFEGIALSALGSALDVV